MTTYGARKPKPFNLRFYRPVYQVVCAICKRSYLVNWRGSNWLASNSCTHAWVETRSYTFKVAKEESEERSKQCIDSYFAFVAEQITLLNKETAKP